MTCMDVVFGTDTAKPPTPLLPPTQDPRDTCAPWADVPSPIALPAPREMLPKWRAESCPGSLRLSAPCARTACFRAQTFQEWRKLVEMLAGTSPSPPAFITQSEQNRALSKRP